MKVTLIESDIERLKDISIQLEQIYKLQKEILACINSATKLLKDVVEECEI